jgi:TonB family protein
MEVSMPHPRTAKSNVHSIFLAALAFLISANVSASPNSGKQQGHLVPPNPSQQYPITVEVLNSPPEVVGFEPYLNKLYYSVRHNLLASMPDSAASEETGVVVVRVHILKDGSLPEKSVRIVFRSGKIDMEDAVLSAIRTAAPFGRLPETFVAPNLDVLFTFYFKSIPPAHKPKFVPVRIAANQIIPLS